MRIDFPRAEVMTLGRNGYSWAHGIEVDSWRGCDTVVLHPVTSRGEQGRARLVVPLTHVRELRDALDSILAEVEAKAAIVPQTEIVEV